ncbi:hypothetical protein [Thermomonas sp.]|uniref:hypothetical protein n=1 Tax=Thermomonas sp. TaxID=1971895 RepID=UPI0035AED43A
MKLDSPREIFSAVRGETDSILKALEQPAINEDLTKAVDSAKAYFSQFKADADAALLELERNAEWDAFTVAFYGETNAGKSTIIETLRILMGESDKLKQRLQFRELYEKYGLGPDAIDAWSKMQLEITDLEEQKRRVTDRFLGDSLKQKMDEQESTSKVGRLEAEMKSMPFWRRWLSFAWALPLKEALENARKELSRLKVEGHTLEQTRLATTAALNEKIAKARQCVAETDARLGKLRKLEDGEIIGDGRSDFTRESHRYEFDVNGEKVVLLDVPGIEGKEDLVREPIMQAVRKAHAVFYVTRKADPPQKGDEKTGTKGTLEKIKEHLGAQTEVWAIFNKSVKSAEQLRMPKLVNDGERGGLAVLESEMNKQLGQHYAGLLAVSAYPAFIASTENFIPGGDKAKDRNKFLMALDADAILRKTGISELIEKLNNEMASNSKQKIRRSNFNKANDVVVQLRSQVALLNKETFRPLSGHLEDQARSSSRQLESAASALKNRLESEVPELINRKRRAARDAIYETIKSDIDNDVFKQSMENVINQFGNELENELPKLVNHYVGEFQEEVKDISERFKNHVQGFLDDASKTGARGFDLKIDIDNGISLGGLVSVGIGAALLWWNPVGWFLGVVAGIGLLISFVKSVYGFFSKDYKMSQQRKAADENIDNVFDAVESDYLNQLESHFQALQKHLSSAKKIFQLPAIQAAKISESLKDSAQRLAGISKSVIKEGKL